MFLNLCFANSFIDLFFAIQYVVFRTSLSMYYVSLCIVVPTFLEFFAWGIQSVSELLCASYISGNWRCLCDSHSK